MKKITLSLIILAALSGCDKNVVNPTATTSQNTSMNNVKSRGDAWDAYPVSDATAYSTSYDVPLTLEYVEGLEAAIAEGNSGVVNFLESDVAAPIVSHIPAQVLAKMKSPDYFLVTQYEISGQRVFSAHTKVVSVHNSVVDDLNGLIR